MKNTTFRKKALLSSVAMLLVALVALGSATFAWFSSNRTVTADGMKVTSAAAQGLVITDDNGQNWGNSSTFTTIGGDTGTFTLTPISLSYSGSALASTAFYPEEVTKNGGAVWTSGSTDFGDGKWNSVSDYFPAIPESVGTESAAATSYFAAYQVMIKSTGEDIKNVYGELTFTDTATTIPASNYIRIAIYKGDTLLTVLGNEESATAITSATPTTATQNLTAFTSGTAYKFISGETVTTDAQAYKILVWYEGQDAECLDAYQQAAASIQLKFAY